MSARPASLSPAQTEALEEVRRLVAESVDGLDDVFLGSLKDALRGVVPFDWLSVLIEDEGRRTFRLLWHTTPSTPSLPRAERIPREELPFPLEDEGAAPSPLIFEDLSTHARRRAQAARALGVQSSMLVPIVARPEGVGWIVLVHLVTGAPSQHALPFITELAHVLAPALARARVTARSKMLYSLVEESPDGMLALDTRTFVSHVNAAAQRMLELPRERIIGRPVAELLGDATAGDLAAQLQLDARSSVVPYEIIVGPARRPVDAVVARVTGTSEASVQIDLRDASARRRMEDATTRRIEQLAFLRSLGEVMASDLHPDKALARAVDLCFVRFELGALCALRSEEDGTLSLAASHGAGPKLRAALTRVRELRPLLGEAFPPGVGAWDKRGLVEAYGVRLPDDAVDAPTRWIALAPFVHARRRLGALLVVGDAGGVPSQGDREIWEAIASTVSVALHAADDFERVLALEAEKRQLVDNLPVIVARLDPATGATFFVNGAIKRILGVSVERAMGTPGVEGLLADAIERDASIAARARAALGATTTWQDRRYRHDDGRILTLRECVYPVLDADRRIRAIEVIAYDITMEIDARKQLMQSDRLASLGALAAGIAHEINNPVAFISLASGQIGRLVDQIGRDDGTAEQRLREMAQEINEGAARIAEIVGELKLFTRIPDGANATPVDINRILQTAITLTSAEIRRLARLEVDLGALPLAPGAFVGLGQAFVNLLINAAQAIESKGERLNGPADVVSVASTSRDGAIVVWVRDTGVGIDPKVISRIFDPFFKTRASRQGAGLGLAIAYDLVRRVGGDIRVESAPGAGTSFEVILPLEPAPDSVASPLSS